MAALRLLFLRLPRSTCSSSSRSTACGGHCSEPAQPGKAALSIRAPLGFFRSVFPHVARATRASLDEASAALVRELSPKPLIECADLLPRNPRFVVVANHYQRK